MWLIRRRSGSALLVLEGLGVDDSGLLRLVVLRQMRRAERAWTGEVRGTGAPDGIIAQPSRSGRSAAQDRCAPTAG